MASKGFNGAMPESDKKQLQELAVQCRGDILSMTTLAASGHPGGSMSTIDMLLTVYQFANINKDNYLEDDRDIVLVSHGHVSPAVYSTLGRNGFFDVTEAQATFRLAGSMFEGHIERSVPGVEWSTGNLGQGLSAACGLALAARVKGFEPNVFVFMGDGEQQKGQIAEARRFAVKYGLKNITLFIDYNQLQISGDIKGVMPQNLREEFMADGWIVVDVDGHDCEAIYNTIVKAKEIDRPVMVLANTVMGKGVSFMENKHGYHGSPLTQDQYDEAMKELGLTNRMDELKKIRAEFEYNEEDHCMPVYEVNIPYGNPKTYDAGIQSDNRSAFGKALEDIAHHISIDKDATPLAVFDCDLAASVKTGGIKKDFPEMFYQAGIQEHHAAVCAGAMSAAGVVTFFADFGVFGVDETYNQQRLNDINNANIKVVTTHLGIDVGEDGKTHQCIDYLGTMRNLYGFQVIIPADPNQTDRATRYAAQNYGNFLVGMGRSKTLTISDENGKPLYGGDYAFEYGAVDVVRKGKYAIISYGAMMPNAMQVWETLKAQGYDVALLNAATPLDLDADLIAEFAQAGKIFTYEDHNVLTGVGSVVSDIVTELGLGCRVVKFGVDHYAYSGKPEDVLKLLGIDPETVAASIANVLKG